MNAKKPNLTADLPRAKAQAKHVGMTPMKARRIVNLIRGTDAAGAIAMLRFAPQAAAEPVAKLIASAVANAEHNQGLNPETLFIETAYVDEGPTLKRFQPRAQGRAFRIRKRTCHITIELVSVEREAGAATASRGSRSGRTAASRGAATSSAASKGRTR